MRAIQMAVACVAVLVATTAQVQAGIIPVGVQNDISVDTVLNVWGWEIIYQDDYSAGGLTGNGPVPISDLFAGVGVGDYVMLAGLQDGSLTFDVLAAGLFEDVTQFTAKNVTHSANGVEWYYNSLSMGFAGLGDSISQISADIAGQSERDRLSWHTGVLAAGVVEPDFMSPGWRSGNNIGLNFSANFDRVVLRMSNDVAAVPEPSSLALFGIAACVAGLGAARRRRREKQQEATAQFDRNNE